MPIALAFGRAFFSGFFVFHSRHQDGGFQILERHAVHQRVKIFFARCHAADTGDVIQERAKAQIIGGFLIAGHHARTSAL